MLLLIPERNFFLHSIVFMADTKKPQVTSRGFMFISNVWCRLETDYQKPVMDNRYPVDFIVCTILAGA